MDYGQRAEALWPHAVWINGGGRYAVVSECALSQHWPRYLQGETVKTYDTPAEAEAAKDFIDTFACGGACHRRHYIVDLARVAPEDGDDRPS